MDSKKDESNIVRRQWGFWEFDIEEFEKELEESEEIYPPKEKLITSERLRSIILVVVMTIIGFWIGPAALNIGDYQAVVKTSLPDGTTIQVDFPFSLGEETGGAQTLVQELDGYRLEVEGLDSYAIQIAADIRYSARVVDQLGEPVSIAPEDMYSELIGETYQQELPPTARDGEWHVFKMRIPFKARISTALLFAVATLWLTEVIPLSAAAFLVPVVAVVAGISGAPEILQPFFSPIVVLFFAGFLLATGLRETNADRLIALSILKRASSKPSMLMLTMMLLAAFFSLWMSNTASVALIIPIAMAVINSLPKQQNQKGFRKALILGIAYAGSMGGIGSAIGTPANILAIDFLNKFGIVDLSFSDWFAFGLPVVFVMVPLIWVYLLFAFNVKLNEVSKFDRSIYQKELEKMGGITREQILLLVTFLSIIVLWLTEKFHGVHTSIIALAAVFVLFFTRTIEEDDLGKINWDALLTFGGGLAIGSVLVSTGVSDWLALKLIVLANLPPLLVIAFVAAFTLIIGAFISNTACAAMLIPLSIPLAQILHIDPRLLVAVIAIGSSIDFALVIGTPPTMLAYSTGMFKVEEIFKRGIILDVLGLMVLSFVVIWIWVFLGVVSF